MIKTIKNNIILFNKFFQVSNNDVVFPNGKKGTHLKIKPANNQGFGVSILVELEDKTIALLDNFRYAINKSILQNVKGGNGTDFIDLNDAIQCAKEELEEEMGLEAKDFIYCGEFYESPSLLTTRVFCFIARECIKKENRKKYQEDTEVINNIISIKPEEIDNFLLENNTCLSTAFLLTKYQIINSKK